MHQLTELVSIISPAFNASSTISTTINSVLNQSYENWEMLIADDCSSDNTVDIVKSYHKKDSRISLYQNTINLGPAGTRNMLLRKARGRFIAFLDTDDQWLPNKLTKQIDKLHSCDAAICCSGYRRQSSLSAPLKKPFFQQSLCVFYQKKCSG